MTQEEIAFNKTYRPPSYVPEMGAAERLLGGVANIVPELGKSIVRQFANLAGGPDPEFTEDPAYFNPPPQGLAQTGAEIGSALMPFLAELALLRRPSVGLTNAIGLGKAPLAARTVQDAIGFGALGLTEDREMGLQQAAEGAGYGLTTGLSRVKRLLPLAGIAAGSKMYFDSRYPDPIIETEDYGDYTQGDISAYAGFLTGIFPGRIPTRIPPQHIATPQVLQQKQPRQLMNRSLQRGDEVIEGEFSAYPNVLPRYPRAEMRPPELSYGGPHPFAKLPPDIRPSIPELQQAIPTRDAPINLDYDYINSIWGTKGMQVADDVMEDFLASLEIVGLPRQQLDTFFHQVGEGQKLDNNAKMRLLWRMIHNMHNAEADFNPQLAKIATPEYEKMLQQFVYDRNLRANEISGMRAIRDAEVDAHNVNVQRPSPPQNPEADFNPQRGRVEPVDEAAHQRMIEQRAVLGLPPEHPQVLDSFADQTKSKLQSLPEWMRTQGGGVDLRALMPIVRAAIGGTAGYAASGEEGAAVGAAAGLLPELARVGAGIAQRIAKPIGKQNNVGSIDIRSATPRSARSMFDGSAFEGIEGRKSRSKIVDMSIEDFQKLHYPLENITRKPEASDAASKGIKWASLPQLLIENSKVISVEGRNRAAYLKSKGYTTMPVEVRDRMIRWDEVSSAEIPKTLKAEGRLTDEVPFPSLQSVQKPVIVSTAVQRGGQLYRGKKWNDMHNAVGMNNLDNFMELLDGKNVPQEERGFIIRDADGTERFTNNRDEAAKIAKEAGQTNVDRNLNSEDLIGDAPQPKLRPLNPEGESGHVFPGLAAAVGRFGIGGVIGGALAGSQDEGDFATGAMVGGLISMFGPAVARDLLKGMSGSMVKAVKGTKGAPSFFKNLNENFEKMSGAAFSSSATASQRLVRFLDQQFNITIPKEIRNALLNAKGMSAALMDIMDDRMAKIGLRYSPSDAMKILANKYLDDATVPNAAINFRNAAMAMDGSDATKRYVDMVVTSREVMTGLQKMVASGVGDKKMQDIINKSLDKYLTRSYKIFTDAKWKPDAKQIDKVAQEVFASGVWPSMTVEQIHTHLDTYIREVKTGQGLYQSGAFTSKTGQMIGQQILKPRKAMSAEWREFLGETTDPLERINQTVFKLRPMAEASKYFETLAKTKEDGWLPHFFENYRELNRTKEALELDVAKYSPGSPAYDTAKAKLDKFNLKWEGAQSVDNHPKFGQLRNGVVTRNAWDTLRTFDHWTDTIESPLLRSIGGMHTAIKIGRTALSPIQVVRNVITMPFFAMIAKANVSDMVAASKILRDADHPMRREIMEMGIGNVDQVKTEFFKEFENITGGKYDFGTIDTSKLGLGVLDFDLVERAGRRGLKKILNAYRTPDNIVRVGSYLSAKARYAEQLGKPLDDIVVKQMAADFTNRYTMNYDAVAPAIKSLRTLPLTNLFLSYTAEIARIMKNLVQDVAAGGKDATHSRMYAGGILAMLTTFPSLMQSAAESSLSPKDREEWEAVKKLMPYYAKNKYYFNIKRGANGQFTYDDFTPLVISDSLNQMVRALISGDVKTAFAINPVFGLDNTPALNIAASQIMGRDIHSKREFRTKDLGNNVSDRVAQIAKEVLPPWTPGVGFEYKRWKQAYSTNEQGEQGITNEKTGVRITPQDFWQPFWSGVKGGSVNLSVLKQRKISEYKREIANETAYLNDVLRSDIEDSKKGEAIAKSRLAITELLEAARRETESTSDHK